MPTPHVSAYVYVYVGVGTNVKGILVGFMVF